MRTEPSSTGKQLQFRIAGHPTMHALAGDGSEESLPRTIEYWQRRESTGILAFNLGQQFLDIIYIAALPEAHFVRFGFEANARKSAVIRTVANSRKSI